MENKIKQRVKKFYWRLTGFILWIWIIDAFISKLSGNAHSNISNLLLITLALPMLIFLIRKDIRQFIGYPLYLMVFPVWAPFFVLKYFFDVAKIVFEILTSIFRLFDAITHTRGAIILTCIFIVTHILILKYENIYILISLILLCYISLYLLIISILKWAHNPYRPIVKFQEALVDFGKKVGKLVFNISVAETMTSKDNQKIKKGIDNLKTYESMLNKIRDASGMTTISLKKKVTALASFVFIIYVIITLVGYSGFIIGFNKLACSGIWTQWLSVQDISHECLFKDLPANASYGESLFFSFSIMTISQDFTLLNTSIAGRLLMVSEIFTILFILTLVVSVVFTTISQDTDIQLVTLESVRSKALLKVVEWREVLEKKIIEETHKSE